MLMIFGGCVMTREYELSLPHELSDNGIFITLDFVIGSKKISELEQASFVNHKCEPNAGFEGQSFLVAMRDIREGEEITFDYSMVLAPCMGANVRALRPTG